MLWYLLAITVLLAFSALFSGSETALFSLTHGQREGLKHLRPKASRRIEQLLSDMPTEASLTGKYRFTFLGGLHDQITFEINNPNKLTFLATDITVKINRIDRNKTRLISNGTLADGIITPQNITRLQGDMPIPLTQLWPRLGERFIPDRLQVILRANITIQGLNQTIWIGVIGYQDFPFHQ